VSTTEQDLTLVLNARNVANSEVDGFRRKVEASAAAIEGRFTHMGDKLVERFHRKDVKELGNAISGSILALATGGDVTEVIGQAGLAMAAGMVSSFAAQLLTRLASSTLVTTLLGTLTGLGTTIGGFISAAIPVGMALLPVLLVAALVAAVAFLIANPQIAGKIAQVAGDIVRFLVGGLVGLGAKIVATIVGGLVGLGRALVEVFGAAFGRVLNVVTGIVGLVLGVIGGIVKAIRDALAWLGQLAQAGRDFNKNNPVSNFGPFGAGAHHDAGGWVGLRGPELGWLGERGPEFVRKAGTGTGDGGGTGVRIVGVSARELVDMIDRGLYFRLQRAAPTLGRT
jgi:hypothetical protein